jgi:EAL domain-containing protein (putative c-di-GMP-specific phosphodiesterase class I)
MLAPRFSHSIASGWRLACREILRAEGNFLSWSDTERNSTGPLWQRWRTLLLLSVLVTLLLQVNFIGVSIPTAGHQATTLPLHLQAGLLLAIGIIYRDRRMVAVCYLATFFAWYARHYYHFAMPINGALPGLIFLLASIPLVWLCAHWMGPRRHLALRSGMGVRDVLRLGWVGLVVFPVGAVVTALALIPVFGADVWASPEMVLRHVLGRAFGVLIIAFPVVVAWSERYNPHAKLPSRAESLKLVCLLLGIGLFVTVKHGLLGAGHGAEAVLHLSTLEVVVILFALLGWCALYLPPAAAVAVASALMLIVFVFARAHFAEIGWGNFVSLVVVVYELAALQLAFIGLVVKIRDARLAHTRLQAKTQYDPVTGLPNLEALRARFATIARSTLPAPGAMACLVVDVVDVPGAVPRPLQEQTYVASSQAVAASLADLAEVFLIGSFQFVLLPRHAASADAWNEVVARIERGDARTGQNPGQLLAYVGVVALIEGVGGLPVALDDAVLEASRLACAARRQGELAPRFSRAGGSSDWGSFDADQPDPVEVFTCLRGGHMVLYFQGINRLPAARGGRLQDNGGLSGEILCRMRTTDDRMLMPAAFTPLLEAAGRGAELDLAVVRAVVCMLQQHAVAPTHFRRLSINLSGQGLASRSFHAQLWRTLARSPIPLSCFCFEITETAAIGNTHVARELLQRLRAAGCQVAIDDFGTGLQTFERLKEFPVDVIKIDGSFVRGVAQRGSDYALVQACVGIAKAFGAETVAEYVENEAISQVLSELGVDWAQGHLYGEPRPFAEVLL